MNGTVWPPAPPSAGDLDDLRAGMVHAFGADPQAWDPLVRELYELARITGEVTS